MNDHTPHDQTDAHIAPDEDPLVGEDFDVAGSGPSGGALALLALALLVLAGGGVYLIGSVMSADSETADAQAAAEEEIAQFDPNEFQSNFTEEDLDPDSSPDSIPMADEAPTSTASTPPDGAPVVVGADAVDVGASSAIGLESGALAGSRSSSVQLL